MDQRSTQSQPSRTHDNVGVNYEEQSHYEILDQSKHHQMEVYDHSTQEDEESSRKYPTLSLGANMRESFAMDQPM